MYLLLETFWEIKPVLTLKMNWTKMTTLLIVFSRLECLGVDVLDFYIHTTHDRTVQLVFLTYSTADLGLSHCRRVVGDTNRAVLESALFHGEVLHRQKLRV